jgi:hypothetical protein
MAKPTPATGPVPLIDTAERRARLATRHHLAPAARGRSPIEPARDLIGYHATDPASVYLQALARTAQCDVATVSDALYEERALVRMLGMRRTMFVVPVELVPLIQAAATNGIAARELTVARRLVELAGVTDDPAAWLSDVAERTVGALERRGEAVATELTKDVPELAVQVPVNEGKAYAGTIGISTRVLFMLSTSGRIVRARPRGTWISSQYRWTPAERWIPGGIAALPEEQARADLVRRWLAAFGPGTTDDLRWWTGWTLGATRKALAAVGAVEVALDDGTAALALPDDLGTTAAPAPWAALLPALDATVMGWKGRGWYLGEHAPRLFDRNGNAGPTVWWDGRVVGGWGQRPNAEVVIRLFDDVGREAAAAIDAEADRVARFVDGQRVTPRFRTPLEAELASA